MMLPSPTAWMRCGVEGLGVAAVAEEENSVAGRPGGAVLALAGREEEGRGQGDE